MGEIIPYMTWYIHPVTSLFDGVLSLAWRLRVSDQRAQGFSLATRDRPFSREVLCVQEGARLASADRNEDISHFTFHTSNLTLQASNPYFIYNT